MFLINQAMESVGIGTAAVIVVLGMAVVFFGLILLMLVTKATGRIMSAQEKKKEADVPGEWLYFAPEAVGVRQIADALDGTCELEIWQEAGVLEIMYGGESSMDMEEGTIQIAPLAYMRGRTLDDSFIILDEAQNTTREQMKMFLTRLGFGSKIVITGDITQIDLPGDKVSGLKEAIRVLDGVEDIQICRLTPADVVRHVLVQRIVAAYDKYEKSRLPDDHARKFTQKPQTKRNLK